MTNNSGDKVNEPAIGISYSVQVGDGRSVVFQSYVAKSDGLKVLNSTLDLLRQSADRQVAFGKLEGLDNDIELKERLVNQLTDGIAALDEKFDRMKGADPKGRDLVPKAEREQRENALKSLAHERKAIHLLEQKKAKIRHELGA